MDDEKEKIEEPENLKQVIYDHGGCRIYFEKGRKRDLIADGYKDERFAKALMSFIQDYYSKRPFWEIGIATHSGNDAPTCSKCRMAFPFPAMRDHEQECWREVGQ